MGFRFVPSLAMIVVLQGWNPSWIPCRAFTAIDKSPTKFKTPSKTCLRVRDGSNDEKTEKMLPQLPALGPGSCSSGDVRDSPLSGDSDYAVEPCSTHLSGSSNSTTPTAFVSPKFELQYTCKVCETRNRVIINRMAYREGMVIAICKGCESKHWIADNLDPALTANNIEEFFANSDKQEQVNRVTQEVYDIERVWGFKGGEMLGEDGRPVLE